MNIKITKEDIKNGTRCDCENCPIALACIRDLNPRDGVRISVEAFHVSINDLGDSGEVVCFDLSTEASNFVDNSDEGEDDKVKPFSFDIDEKIIQKLKSKKLIY